MSAPETDMLAAALAYAARGWAVFPLHTMVDGRCSCGTADCPDAGKHPRVRRGMKEATTDAAKLNEWFGPGAPPANIGIATGEVSGITVLDIDTADGKRGAETWAALIAEKGEPDTLMARTGSGGMHVLFKYNSALKTSANVLGPGVDVRNDGGYIVAAPSRHRSGKAYAWENDAPLADLPAHLAQRKETRGRPRKDDPTRRKYGLPEIAAMLEKVPADDRDLWRNVGVILGREFNRSDEAWQVYQDWSAKWDGTPGRNHDATMREAFYEISQQATAKELSLGTIVAAAIAHGWVPKGGELPIDSFLFYGPGNNFIYRRTTSFWIAEAVNAACAPVNCDGKLVSPADWLRRNALVTSMTSDPDLKGEVVKGVDYREGVQIAGDGAATFNTYRGPTISGGDAARARPWVEHVRRVFPKPGDADQFLDYMAHRVQRPGEKPRFALLIAGDQGVGKDTAVDMAVPAIGAWNVASVEAEQIDSGFNEHAAKVLVRVSEAANQHDISKWAFNERLKVLIAGNPDYATINPKYGHKYSVRLHCGVAITTNHLLSGVFIPQDDRRYDVIACATKAEMGIADDAACRSYFEMLWGWFANDGGAHVAAFLRQRDINKFSASNGQRKTEAHRSVVQVGLGNNHWLLDILEGLGEPDLIRADVIVTQAMRGELDLSRQQVMQRLAATMHALGYTPLPCATRADGRWMIGGKRVTVYGKRAALNITKPEDIAAKIAALPEVF